MPEPTEPLVIIKVRLHLDGSRSIVYYACGPQRETEAEALADALLFAKIQGERAMTSA